MQHLLNGEQLKTTRRTVVKSDEKVSEYLLDDGTIIRLRTVLTGAYQYDGKTDEHGNPIYYLTWQVVQTAEPGA
ncbi:MAG: hypothetical protein ACYCZR_00975 [Burkholderiales bacterium]